jgi:hypothetical protein
MGPVKTPIGWNECLLIGVFRHKDPATPLEISLEMYGRTVHR